MALFESLLALLLVSNLLLKISGHIGVLHAAPREELELLDA